MFNHYSDEITVQDDELYIENVRISGNDIYEESSGRGVCVCAEIVRDSAINCHEVELSRALAGISAVIAVGIGMGVAVALE